MGKTDLEDALQKLDILTQEEARMASAELLRLTYGVDGKVLCVGDNLEQVNRSSSSNLPALYCKCSNTPTGSLLRDSLLRWLSPPDPSTNHNIACSVHHDDTSEWFFRGSVFSQWKATGSFLWLHGKRTFILALLDDMP